jgi:hypothetical protein
MISEISSYYKQCTADFKTIITENSLNGNAVNNKYSELEDEFLNL